jgi:hypothetical protein
MQIIVGLREETDHARAHVDLYPTGAPDGVINLPDYLLLLQLVLTN